MKMIGVRGAEVDLVGEGLIRDAAEKVLKVIVGEALEGEVKYVADEIECVVRACIEGGHYHER